MITKLIKEYIVKHGFDGLYCANRRQYISDCSCGVSKLNPKSRCLSDDCIPGYRTKYSLMSNGGVRSINILPVKIHFIVNWVDYHCREDMPKDEIEVLVEFNDGTYDICDWHKDHTGWRLEIYQPDIFDIIKRYSPLEGVFVEFCNKKKTIRKNIRAFEELKYERIK